MRPLPSFARHGLLISAAASLALTACDRAPQTPPAAAPAPPPAPVVPPTPPLQPTVDRAELLSALDAAASAFAAGQADDTANLDGRRFAVRLAFGCAGPTPRAAARPAGLASWSWGRGDQTIDLTLQPADWTADLASESDAAEAIEGLWLERPWMRADGCPAAPAPVADAAPASPAPTNPAPAGAAPAGHAPAKPPPAKVPPPRQTAGLASVFAQGGSRVGRRDGKAFSYTVRGDKGPPTAPTAGYRLLIEGRFTVFPGGGTIRCSASGPEQRPACLAASTIDRVVFESAEGRLLSEWRPG